MMKPLALLRKAHGAYYGWWNVALVYPAMIFMFITPILLLTFAYPAIMADTGWSRGEVTAIASIKFGTSALIAFFVGALVDKIGVRPVVVLCGLITGTGMVLFLYVDSLSFFYLLGIPLGFSASVTMISVKVLVTRWFNDRLGLALGVALASTGIGGTFIAPLSAWMIEGYGWRTTFAFAGVGIWLFAIPFFIYGIREYPSEEEALKEFGPDHQNTARPVMRGRGMAKAPDGPAPDFVFRDIFRRKEFWVVALVLIIVGFVDQGKNQHAVIFLKDEKGLDLTMIGLGIGLTFSAGMLSKLGFGWLFDKMSLKGVAICYITIAISIALAFPVEGFITLIIFLLARGLSHGGVLLETPVFARHIFGPHNAGKVIGAFTAVGYLGFTPAPWVIGVMADHYGSYTVPFLVMIGLLLLCAVIIALVRPVYREEMLLKKKLQQQATAPALSPAE